MGRMFGWVVPVLYISLIVGLAWNSIVLLSSGMLVNARFIIHGLPLVLPAGLNPRAVLFTVFGMWVMSLVWFFVQAGIDHPDPLEDERWCNHLMNVAFVSRFVLMPVMVALVVYVSYNIYAYILVGGTGLLWGLLTWLLAFLLNIPGACYQVSAAVKYSNRGIISSGSLPVHVLFAFLPVLGFISMCALFVNGKESLISFHDARITRTALSHESGLANNAQPAGSEQASKNSDASMQNNQASAYNAQDASGSSRQAVTEAAAKSSSQQSNFADSMSQSNAQSDKKPLYLRDVVIPAQPSTSKTSEPVDSAKPLGQGSPQNSEQPARAVYPDPRPDALL